MTIELTESFCRLAASRFEAPELLAQEVLARYELEQAWHLVAPDPEPLPEHISRK